jgi:hypothetical protein
VEQWRVTTGQEAPSQTGDLLQQMVQTRKPLSQGNLVELERLPVPSVFDVVSRVIG